MTSKSLRFKLYSLLSLPIVALIALWTFVTGHVLTDFFDLRTSSTVYEYIAVPSATLISELQGESKASAIHLSVAAPERAGLDAARKRTDQAVSHFIDLVTSSEVATVGTPELRAGIDEVLLEISKIRVLRERVELDATPRSDAVLAYGKITDAVFALYDRLITVPEIELFQQAVGMRRIAHARDLLPREDALISGAILAGRLSNEEYENIEVLAPTRKLLLRDGIEALDAELRAPYDRLLASAENRSLIELEHEIVESAALPANSGAWRSATENLGPAMDALQISRLRLIDERASRGVDSVILTFAIVGGAGVLAILAALIWSARLGRSLVRELAELRRAATDLADVRLPALVERLRQGEVTEAEEETWPLADDRATQEVRDLGQAFHSVQRTAVQAAVGQAELRQGLNRIFRNLARRNQSLVHRQLGHLNAMQLKATEPDALDDLFKLDHLTTRMRRQAEGLIILSGAPAGRSWRSPVPMLTVVRGAVAEVEAYRRVDILPFPEASLAGSATADVIHLLSELVENATGFSPPNTQVTVGGEVVGRGFVVEIEDRGLGLSEKDLDALNERLNHPPEFDMADTDRLGLFVVARLALRHGIMVTLRRSSFGGTTAVVLIPLKLTASDFAHSSTD